MNPLLIVNPSAGGGRAGRTFAALRPVVERVLGRVDVQITTRAGHAILLARDAAQEGRELVIALGGDGTLHEVANGVLAAHDTYDTHDARHARASSPSRTAIGFIAEGTGGDFRKSLGLAHRLDQYLEAIASGRERRVDAARATYRNADGTEGKRWFVNILSAGLGGKVDRFVTEAPRALPPTAAYLWASLRAVAGTDQARMSLVVERPGRTELRLEAWFLAVCNGTTFGSGMRVAPMAKVDDGRLEIVALSAPSKLAFLQLASRLYGGTHIGHPGVLHLYGERVEIAPLPGPGAEPVLLDIDGEPLGRLPVAIEIVPGDLRIRA